MRSEKIINALGKIDDRLVMEVFPGMPIQKKQHWPTVLATAAVVGVCMLGCWQLGVFRSPEVTIEPMAKLEAVVSPSMEDQQTESETIETPTVDWDAFKDEIRYKMRKGGASTEIQDAMLLYLQTNCMDELPEWQNRLWWYEENYNMNPTELPALYIYQFDKQAEEFRMDYLYYEDGHVKQSSSFCIMLKEVKEKILSAPAPEEITESIKLEFFESISSDWNPTTFVLLQWDCTFEILDTYQNMSLPHLVFTGEQETQIVTVEYVLYANTVTFASRHTADRASLTEYTQWLETVPGAQFLTEEAKSEFARYLTIHMDVKKKLGECEDIYIDTVLVDWIEYPRLNLRDLTPYSYTSYVFNGEQIVEDAGSYSAELYWTDFTDRFSRERYFAGAEEVGVEARNAARRFFRENPEWLDAFIGGNWSWRLADVQGRRAAVLDCEAPILKHLGESQIFRYFYDDGTFETGPSGYWPGDGGVDLKLMAVHALKAKEPDRLQRLRDVYALYNYENPETLQFVVSVNEGDPVYERKDEVVYYRLVSAELVNEEQQIYELQFEGMTICVDDLDNSENWNTAQSNYNWGSLYQDWAQEAVIQAMASEKTYEDQLLTVSQTLTVDVQITTESNPFEPLAAIRITK